MRDAAPLTVLDVRWRLDRPDGRADYEAGHIPGAVYVSLDDELAAHGAPEDGRHPLPDIADLQTAAERLGSLPQTARGKRTRDALIAAARTVFERDGYVDSRLVDIAAEVERAADFHQHEAVEERHHRSRHRQPAPARDRGL